MEPSERRRHERVPQGGRVVGRATVMTELRVAALSEEGATLEAVMPMAPGSACDLSLNLGEGSLDLRARVRSVASLDGGEGGPFEVKVEFESLDEADRAMLRFFLDSRSGAR